MGVSDFLIECTYVNCVKYLIHDTIETHCYVDL